jgi:hypothetical protein
LLHIFDTPVKWTSYCTGQVFNGASRVPVFAFQATPGRQDPAAAAASAASLIEIENENEHRTLNVEHRTPNKKR